MENERERNDIRVENHGSIVLLRPTNHVGELWMRRNIPDAMTLGDARAVEPRYAHDIIDGAYGDGLEVA